MKNPNEVTAFVSMSTGRRSINLSDARKRSKFRKPATTCSSQEQIRAAVEGFAVARNTGSIRATLTPSGDATGRMILELCDLRPESSNSPSEMQDLEYSPSQGSVGPISDSPKHPVRKVEQQFLEENARSNEELATILSQSDMLSLTALAGISGWSREEILSMQENGDLLALRGVSARCKYPEWQLVRRGGKMRVLEGVSEVLEALGGDMWASYNLLTSELPDSGKIAWKVLQNGDLNDVLDLISIEEA